MYLCKQGSATMSGSLLQPELLNYIIYLAGLNYRDFSVLFIYFYFMFKLSNPR